MLAMFEEKIARLRQLMVKENLEGVFISSVANIAYLTGYTNFSKEEREAYLFIGKNFEYLITDGRYTQAVKEKIPHLTIFERGNGKSTEDLFKKHPEIKTLGIEEDNLTVGEYKFIKKHFKKIKHFPVNQLRVTKTADEIAKIQKACDMGDQTFQFIVKQIKVGVSEKQIAGELEKFIKDQRAELSFPTIVAFGKNSAVPHHQTSDKRLTINDKFVLLDFGVKYQDYCSDMTRTIFFGEPAAKQKEIYQVVLEAQKKAVELINKGQRKASEIDKVARDYIVKAGYPSIPHSLGHGIGLEVHELPYISHKSKQELKEGMVFSIEPGIYLPNFGGVRIEDLYVLEKTGLKQITNSLKELTIT